MIDNWKQRVCLVVANSSSPASTSAFIGMSSVITDTPAFPITTLTINPMQCCPPLVDRSWCRHSRRGESWRF
ncbi:uncharacterized protein BDW70DRAFT_132830 [Aspergillus foveolatus]|uniref:uncharacterized protein n=1 Tax=Aspergillus foveolatus TaxID=210207 RepID=UPI003CCE09C2